MTTESTVWSLYVLRCSEGSLYTGITTDVPRRIREHTVGSRGARYLRGRAPLQLVFEVAIGDRGAASRAEHRVKRLSKREKEALLAAPGELRERILKFASG